MVRDSVCDLLNLKDITSGLAPIENSYGTLKQIDKIIREVEFSEDQNESGLLLREHKALLINAAKQFQETIVATSAVRTY